jgi:integrase
MKMKLTDRDAMKVGAGLYWDSDRAAPRGFLLRVTAAGARAWCLNYRTQETQRERRVTIGDVASWPVDKARKRAAELRRIVDQGGDPLGDAQEKRAAPTVAELVERFKAEALPRRAERTQAEYRAMFDRYILPALGDKKVAAVDRADVERLHAAITAEGKPRRANAVVTVASLLFSQAAVWKLRPEHNNPTRRIVRNREPPRERYLNPEEIDRLNAVLDRWRDKEPDSVDQIRLLMLTGSRRGEVLAMTWSQIDLDGAVWTKPALVTKPRKASRVVLADEAVELLRRRLAERERDRVVPLRKDERVFRGSGVVAYRLERHWFVIRAAAGLDNLRLHDLRHSWASAAVSEGVPLAVIGKQLGHGTMRMTERYSHLFDEPVRAAAAVVGKYMSRKKAPQESA